MGRDAGELTSLLHTQLVRKQFQTQRSRTKSPKTNAQLGAPSNSGSVPVDVSDGEPKPCGEDVGGSDGRCMCLYANGVEAGTPVSFAMCSVPES